MLVSSHWICLLGVFGDPKPTFSGLAGLDKSPSASMVSVLGSAWESSFVLTLLGKTLFGGKGMELPAAGADSWGTTSPKTCSDPPEWGNEAASLIWGQAL